MMGFKNHANMENRGNREIRETGFLFVYFAYFAVKEVFLREDFGVNTPTGQAKLMEAY